MLKDKMGGTWWCMEKRLAARKMVPSPPMVVTKSIFLAKWWVASPGAAV